MDKPEDEKYWTSSATKGFDFDSEDNLQVPHIIRYFLNLTIISNKPFENFKDQSADIFGATVFQTAQLSKEVKQQIPQQLASSSGGAHMKLSQSLSSLSTNSNSSQKLKASEPSKQCEITCKLLSSTFNVRPN